MKKVIRRFLVKLYEIVSEIKRLRVEKSLTQKELAIKSGISRVTLGKVERGELGNISVKTFDLLLSNLGKEIEFKSNQGFGYLH